MAAQGTITNIDQLHHWYERQPDNGSVLRQLSFPFTKRTWQISEAEANCGCRFRTSS